VLLAAPGSKCAFTSVVKVATWFTTRPASVLVAVVTRANVSHLLAAKLQHKHFLHGERTHTRTVTNTQAEGNTHISKRFQSRGSLN